MLEHTLLRSSDSGEDAGARARRSSRRSDRYEARAWLWRHSKLSRVRSCGRGTRKDADVTVKVSTDDAGNRTAGFGGVQTCGSVWSCPPCAAKIASGRQQEIAGALECWHKMGGRVALLTLTMRHRAGDSLADLWAGLSKAWHKATSGATWLDDQQLAGSLVLGDRLRIPIIRVVEATVGDNGWHLHVHALLMLGSHVTDSHVSALGASMFSRWQAALVKQGLRSPSRRRGVDVKLLGRSSTDPLSKYFTKAVYSASMEVARGDLKDTKHGNRTPFGLLADVVAVYRDGGSMPSRSTAGDEDLWAEWERASKGRRQITWSHGLRDLLTTEPELTDQELADAEMDGQVEAVIDRDTWGHIVTAEAQLPLLVAFEHSRDAGVQLLARYRAGHRFRKSRE